MLGLFSGYEIEEFQGCAALNAGKRGAEEEMVPCLAPLEESACLFDHTDTRHERARWLPAAQCNQGIRAELDTLLRGLVAVRLR